MASKERLQNPIVGDDITLRQFVFNSNNVSNVEEVQKVEIYFLDPEEVSETNTDGRRLVETITTITNNTTGEYSVVLNTSAPTYTIGKYIDIWHIAYEEADDLENRIAKRENTFKILSDKWYTTPFPVVYDFSFKFTPNKVRKGSSKFLQIQIIPNVARASDLAKFYENLAIYTDISISIKQICGDCMPQEEDLRLIVDCDSIDFKEKCFGYYKLDTTEDGLDMICGIYNVWFTLNYGGNTYISDNMQLQIYD